jgi:hypothetical protein
MKIITADMRRHEAEERGIDFMGFQLNEVVKSGDMWKPQRIMISGTQGVGKTTFAATFESPILLQIEDGAAAIDCATFPDRATHLNNVFEAMDALYQGDHNFKTVIIDTADWLEVLIHAYTVEMQPTNEKGVPVADIEGYGYGKGFKHALKHWENVLQWLDALRDSRDMNAVLLAHTEVKRHEPPDSDPYDRYQIKLAKSASALVQEWADLCLFVKFKTNIIKADAGFGREVSRGSGTGERVIYTEERPAWVAKNRWSLPPEIYIGTDKQWTAFHVAFSEATSGRYQLPPTIETKTVYKRTEKGEALVAETQPEEKKF